MAIEIEGPGGGGGGTPTGPALTVAGYNAAGNLNFIPGSAFTAAGRISFSTPSPVAAGGTSFGVTTPPDTVTGGILLISGNSQLGTSDGTITLLDVNNAGAAGDEFNGFRLFNTGTVTNGITMQSLGNNASFGGQFRMMEAQNSGVGAGGIFYNLGNQASMTSNFDMLNITDSGDHAGNNTMISINRQGDLSGGGDATGLAIGDSGNADQKTGITVSISGAATGQVKGALFDVGSATSPQQKVALQAEGGATSISSPFSTAALSPVGVFQNNSIGGSFLVADGFPITNGAFGFGNNLAITTQFDDDMDVDSLGGVIGFSVNGLVNNLLVASGKTAHTLNYMVAGGGTQAGGGTIENVAMFKAVGLLGAPTDVTVDKMVGFHGASLLSAFGTECWGVKIDADVDSYFPKVAIGTVSEKVSGTNILEVNGPAQFDGNIGFFGTTPVAQEVGGAQTAGGTYGATEQGMLQTVYDAMRAYGLLS